MTDIVNCKICGDPVFDDSTSRAAHIEVAHPDYAVSKPVKPGVWWFASKSDPRWNAEGRTPNLVLSVGLPPEANRKLDELVRRLGRVPADLEFGCMKY